MKIKRRESSAAQPEATESGRRPISVATFLHLVHSRHRFGRSDGSRAAPSSDSRVWKTKSSDREIVADRHVVVVAHHAMHVRVTREWDYDNLMPREAHFCFCFFFIKKIYF